MLSERCEVLGSLLSCPRQITTPCLIFAENETCIGICQHQDNLLVLLVCVVNCLDQLFPILCTQRRGRRGQAWHESNHLMQIWASAKRKGIGLLFRQKHQWMFIYEEDRSSTYIVVKLTSVPAYCLLFQGGASENGRML